MDILGTNTINALRSILTLLAFAAFIGIVFWAWSGARQEKFAEAAQIPFDEDRMHTRNESQDSNNSERTGSEQTDAERSSK